MGETEKERAKERDRETERESSDRKRYSALMKG